MQITPFLMYEGCAEEAMNFYVSIFPRARVVSVMRYGPNEAGREGTVKRAQFEINATRLMCVDSAVVHDFGFTPAVSLYVDCGKDDGMEQIFERLSENGQVLMAPGNYGFSRKFAWTQDKYGVSWQLNLH
ncbi:MAG TPA: VOC family protein [Burkholderiales bacterium]|jgi:predicted 3-demethylubiquinone-9 3-methyltransferase (glyoxalase superfamily)